MYCRSMVSTVLREGLPEFSELEPWASIRKMAFLKAIFVHLIGAHGRIDGKYLNTYFYGNLTGVLTFKQKLRVRRLRFNA